MVKSRKNDEYERAQTPSSPRNENSNLKVGQQSNF